VVDKLLFAQLLGEEDPSEDPDSEVYHEMPLLW
jgi:hypothetical protein